jgi:hypothetical protein
MLVGVVAFVAIFVGPDWLAFAAYAVLVVNLIWLVFTRRGSRMIADLHEAGALPRRFSLQAIRVFVAVDLAIIGLLFLAR